MSTRLAAWLRDLRMRLDEKRVARDYYRTLGARRLTPEERAAIAEWKRAKGAGR